MKIKSKKSIKCLVGVKKEIEILMVISQMEINRVNLYKQKQLKTMINKFESFEGKTPKEIEPYIIICFNVNLKKDDNNPEGVLKGEPIKGVKNMKRWFQKINHQSRILEMSVGKNIYIEKHNFETMEDLDRWQEQYPEE